MTCLKPTFSFQSFCLYNHKEERTEQYTEVLVCLMQWAEPNTVTFKKQNKYRFSQYATAPASTLSTVPGTGPRLKGDGAQS